MGLVQHLLLAGLLCFVTIAAPSSKETQSNWVFGRDNATCENSATSRNCWGDYSIDTNYYDTIPNTGVTREYWLVAENTTLAPDGYERIVTVFNGTYPGPTLEANWGDNLIIHVTNNLQDNGTAIHWHGMRQLNSNEYDGVPGVTQCPIAPGDTMTYKFQATQYGTSWYHSHFSVQMGDGLYGPIVIHGPATANYDEDLGPIFITEWFHDGAFVEWEKSGKYGGVPVRANSIAPNGLINGTNTFDCSGSDDPACHGTGKRNLINFAPGTKYLIRVIDSQIDSFMRFSIDGHLLTVIASDLVPIVPYTTDAIVMGPGQRYDIIVEANQTVGNYWMRAAYQECNGQDNDNKDGILGVVRYEGASDVDPTTTDSFDGTVCGDEPYDKLVPHVAVDVGAATTQKWLDLGFFWELGTVFHWTVNTVPLQIDWSRPTNLLIHDDVNIFPTQYNIYDVPQKDEVRTWTYWVIQETVFILDVTHPFHLHGHDFHILAQGEGIFTPYTTELNLKNPPRRDTASMPGNGFLVIAFKTDNPGTWLFHCHIAWHASQNLALQFVERESEISGLVAVDYSELSDTCNNWKDWYPTSVYNEQDDSGI
ncbi:laccase from botrytis Aclada At 1.67 A resolution [Xylariales sp. PMI_506]|nr:laccase from botrytis Aclada At 1.67 A resolution [Xylariales sp. PMI_506]